MLFGKMNQVEELINEGVECTQLKSRNDKILQLHSKLKQIDALEKDIQGKMSSLENHGIQVELEININRYMAILSEIERQFSVETYDIPDASPLRDIERGLSTQVKAMDEKWKNHVTQYSSNLISSLKTVQKISSDTMKISKVTLDLEKLKKASFEGQKSFEQLKLLMNEGQDIISRVGLNDEINGFLKKVANSTASMEDISLEVLEWIKKHEVASKIKLSFKIN
ncbi:MAG: hypothetical protein E7231_09765 [Cellulosilyticum sp.]|nr:hypothetical protein [Cellulosilyticum sp.]